MDPQEVSVMPWTVEHVPVACVVVMCYRPRKSGGSAYRDERG